MTEALPATPLTVQVAPGIASDTVAVVAGPGFWTVTAPLTVQPESIAALFVAVTE